MDTRRSLGPKGENPKGLTAEKPLDTLFRRLIHPSGDAGSPELPAWASFEHRGYIKGEASRPLARSTIPDRSVARLLVILSVISQSRPCSYRPTLTMRYTSYISTAWEGAGWPCRGSATYSAPGARSMGIDLRKCSTTR